MNRLQQALDELGRDVQEAKNLADHRGSRYVGSGASREYAEHVAGGGSAKDYDWYSVKGGGGRVVQPRAGGRASGFAKAVLDIARHDTRGMRPVWEEKALAELTDASGGYLLVPEIASEVMMLIRSRVAVAKMPISRVEPRSKQYLLPGLTTPGASASWLNENAAIPASAENFQIAGSMVPRPLGALVAISNRLLADAVSDNPSAAASAERVITNDVADLKAVALDAGMLQGDASGPGPFGILRYTNTTGLPAGTIATNGSTPTYQILVAIVSALRNISMPFNNPGWIFSGRTLQSLQNLTNSIGEPLLASAGLLTVDASGSTGTLLGYKFATTNAISNAQTYGTATNASSIIFSSDWDELFLGEWQALAIDSSAEASYTPDGGTTWISAYQNMQTVFRATIWADMVIRRPAAFVVANGILP